MANDGFIAKLARADFADALGVVIREDSVAVAQLGKRLQTVTVADVATEKLTGPDEARGAEAAHFLREYVSKRSLEGARTVVVLPRRATFLGQMVLPAEAAENAADAVAFELDRILPVDASAVYHSHYVRPVGSSGEKVAVQVVAARSEGVDLILGLLEEAGLTVSAVTVEPVALADFYAYCVGEQHGPAALCIRSESRYYMTLCVDGMMVSSHHYDPRRAAPAAIVGKEVERNLPERASEEVVLVRERPRKEEEVEFASLAPEGFFPQGNAPSAAEIMSIGAALGQLGETRAPVNLLPVDLVPQREVVGASRLALSAAVVALALVLFGVNSWKNTAIDSALASELDRLSPMVREITELGDENRKLLEKLEFLETSGRSDVLTYLKSLTEIIPKNAYLTTFRFRDERIELDGIAYEASPLVGLLEESPLVENVEFSAPITKYLASQERFSLRMRRRK